MASLEKTKVKMHILERVSEIEKELSKHIGKDKIEFIQSEKRNTLLEESKKSLNSELRMPTTVSNLFVDDTAPAYE
jgi:hypothetical protein